MTEQSTLLRKQLHRAGRSVAYDKQIRAHRVQRRRRIDQRFAFGDA